MLDQPGVVYCHDNLYASSIIPVDDVFCGEQMGCRNTDCPEFMQCKDGESEFESSFEHKHDRIALSDTERRKERGSFIAVGFQLLEGKLCFFSLFIAPYQGSFIRCLLRNDVYHIKCKIKRTGVISLKLRLILCCYLLTIYDTISSMMILYSLWR